MEAAHDARSASRRHARLPDGDSWRSANTACGRADPAAGCTDGADRQHARRTSWRYGDLRWTAGFDCNGVHDGFDRQYASRPNWKHDRTWGKYRCWMSDGFDWWLEGMQI